VTDRQAGSTSPKAQNIASEVRRRIVEREWRQGDRIPDEADLATEFGAARATVNKALQLLADEGLLDRRRRAGTRVAVNPVHKATFSIPIVREQIEQSGRTYSHRVVAQRRSPVPVEVAGRLALPVGAPLIHLRMVHYGDGRPFELEDRWINDARLLETPLGQALLILQRTTWNDMGAITTVRVACHPGYVMSAAT
jgi:GntR family histidine utilization transcriptional repressor